MQDIMEFCEVRYRIFTFILVAIKIIAIFVNIFKKYMNDKI